MDVMGWKIDRLDNPICDSGGKFDALDLIVLGDPTLREHHLPHFKPGNDMQLTREQVKKLVGCMLRLDTTMVLVRTGTRKDISALVDLMPTSLPNDLASLLEDCRNIDDLDDDRIDRIIENLRGQSEHILSKAQAEEVVNFANKDGDGEYVAENVTIAVAPYLQSHVYSFTQHPSRNGVWLIDVGRRRSDGRRGISSAHSFNFDPVLDQPEIRDDSIGAHVNLVDGLQVAQRIVEALPTDGKWNIEMGCYRQSHNTWEPIDGGGQRLVFGPPPTTTWFPFQFRRFCNDKSVTWRTNVPDTYRVLGSTLAEGREATFVHGKDLTYAMRFEELYPDTEYVFLCGQLSHKLTLNDGPTRNMVGFVYDNVGNGSSDSLMHNLMRPVQAALRHDHGFAVLDHEATKSVFGQIAGFLKDNPKSSTQIESELGVSGEYRYRVDGGSFEFLPMEKTDTD